jgi:hypothetical protein
MKRTHLALCLALSAAAGCAGATPTAPARSGTALASVDDKGGRIVCRTERPTGSNIAERVCYREEDLDRRRLQTQDALRLAPQPTVKMGD